MLATLSHDKKKTPLGAFFIARLLNSPLGDDVHRMNDAREITEQGQQDVQPEGASEADLQENPQRREENGDQNADQIHGGSPIVGPAGRYPTIDWRRQHPVQEKSLIGTAMAPAR